MINDKCFLLVGHGGFGNRGCEAIVRSTIMLLEEQFPGSKIILSSFHSSEDSAVLKKEGSHVTVIYAGIRLTGTRWVCRKVLGAIRYPHRWKMDYPFLKDILPPATAVLSVGGDNYTSDYRGLRYFMNLNQYVQSFGKPLVIWGASLGPFKTKKVEVRMAKDLRKVNLITVRESESINYLRSIGVDKNVVSVADPAFLLQPQQPICKINWPAGNGLVAISMSTLLGRYRPDRGTGVTGALISLCQYIIDELKAGVVFVPHVTWPEDINNDCRYLWQIEEAVARPGKTWLLPSEMNASEMKWVISKCQAAVAARTHSAIAAFSTGVPTLSIGYSQKARGLNKDIFGDLRYLLDVNLIDKKTLLDYFLKVWDNRVNIQKVLAEKAHEIKEKARNNVRALAQLLDAK